MQVVQKLYKLQCPEVLNDDSSGAEDEGIDGVEFVPSEKDGLPDGPTKTPDSNMPSIILSQVNIASLSSASTDHHTETTYLGCYDDLVLDIPAMLVQSGSMKFFPKEKKVPSNSTHSARILKIVQSCINLPSHSLVIQQ